MNRKLVITYFIVTFLRNSSYVKSDNDYFKNAADKISDSEEASIKKKSISVWNTYHQQNEKMIEKILVSLVKVF